MKTGAVFLIWVIFFSAVWCQSIIKVPADFKTIQEAIDAADRGDTVLVAEGTYYENIRFNGKAIVVASKYALDGIPSRIDKTVIDGSQPKNLDSSSVVSFVSGEDTNSVLCGFTITGGGGTNLTLWDLWGGGGIVCNFSGAKIINNKIINNRILDGENGLGGGISGWGDGFIIIKDNIIVQNSVYAANSRGGAISLMEKSGIIVNNIIHENRSEGKYGYAFGGGIYCESLPGDGNFVEIKNNSIVFNQSISGMEKGAYSAGIEITQTTVIIEDNIISNNTTTSAASSTAGGMRILYSEPGCIIRNNTFENNSAAAPGSAVGGGLVLQNTENAVLVERNEFLQNFAHRGGGIYLLEDHGSEFIRNVISDNVASELGGGINIRNSSPVIKNNMFRQNQADVGGGIWIYASVEKNNERKVVSEPVLINNTIIKNAALGYAGAIYNSNSYTTFLNSVVWGNIAPIDPQIHVLGGSFDAEFSNIEGGFPGNGNINLAPQFNDTIICCYYPGSPCIDAGTPDSLFDQEDPGNPGFALFPAMGGLRNDMGWHGGMGSGCSSSIITGELKTPASLSFSLEQNYPNPFNPETSFRYMVPAGGEVTIKIFDILGKEVFVLVDEYKEAGDYEIRFNALSLSSGAYFCRMQAGEFVQTRKLMLMK